MTHALFKSAIFAAAVFGSGAALIAHAEQHFEPYEVERSASGDIEFNSESAEWRSFVDGPKGPAAALSAESGVEALATDKSTPEADELKQSMMALSPVRSD